MPRLKDLRRSTDNKVIAGVCGGLAEWLGWKPSTVRILFVVGSFLPVIPGFLVYVILWAFVPGK
jgi:phage shock protein C